MVALRHLGFLKMVHGGGAENAGVENAGVENTGAKTYGKPLEQKIKITFLIFQI